MSERQVQHALRMQAAQRVEAERERLAALLPGGSPERPVIVTSASVIEPHAMDAMPCPHCRGPYRVHEHTRPVPSLRRLDVACRDCGVARVLWYRIAPPAGTDNRRCPPPLERRSVSSLSEIDRLAGPDRQRDPIVIGSAHDGHQTLEPERDR